jgi:diguanylate cyclase (GGDEF)-like protein/PAS domain S-box-containing protein
MVQRREVDLSALASLSKDVSLVVTSNGVFRYLAPSSQRILGWEPAQLRNQTRSHFVHPDDLPALDRSSDHLASGSVVTTVYRFRQGDDSYVRIEDKAHRVVQGDVELLVSTIRPFAASEMSSIAPTPGALTDPLTGLANRQLLMKKLAMALRLLEHSSNVLAVICVDFDRFKGVNAALGHEIGDGLLLKLAQRIAMQSKPVDTLARTSGDEFVLIAEHLADGVAAAAMCEKILVACRDPFKVDGEQIVGSVSVGMSATADSQYGGEELVREANLALYRAKDLGRNRCEIFNEDLRIRAIGRLGTERMLRSAIAEQRIVVEYQPIIELVGGRVVSAEALVRIRDAQESLLLPGSFLDVAIETGLLPGVDRLVWDQALGQTAEWNSRLGGSGFSGVAINVTPDHLEDPAFVTGLIERLDRHRIPPSSLHVEITEHALLLASGSVMKSLRDLGAAGFKVGLDDFGTGYSSLSYLRQLPIDFVKVDQSFVADLDVERCAIVNAIVELSHALGLVVIAEGVETAAQLQLLQDLGCDRAQGYLIARPGPPQVIDALVYAGSNHHLVETSR